MLSGRQILGLHQMAGKYLFLLGIQRRNFVDGSNVRIQIAGQRHEGAVLLQGNGGSVAHGLDSHNGLILAVCELEC